MRPARQPSLLRNTLPCWLFRYIAEDRAQSKRSYDRYQAPSKGLSPRAAAASKAAAPKADGTEDDDDDRRKCSMIKGRQAGVKISLMAGGRPD